MIQQDIRQIMAQLEVLYVEDDDLIRQEMATLLKRRFGGVRLAENGARGLALFQEKEPDLVLTDIRMPVMDGLTMVREIQALNPRTPVIITTAHSDEKFFLESIELGVDAYLLKPISPPRMEETLGKIALGLWEKQEVARRTRFVEVLLESLPAFILVVNNGKVEHVNSALLRFLGLSCIDQIDPEGKIFAAAIRCDPSDGFSHLLARGDWLAYLTSRSSSLPSIRLQSAVEPEGRPLPYAISWSFDATAARQVFTFTDLQLIQKQITDLQKQVYHDPLTGSANRARLYEKFHEEMNRAERYGPPLSIVLVDVDHFKKVNDAFGHNAGDSVLVELVRRMLGKIRVTDLLGRWGGEEFMVIAPETVLGATLEMAENLRQLIADVPFPEVGSVTCSFGVCQRLPGETMHDCLGRADEALYRAKSRGRNRVEMAEAQPSSEDHSAV